jgi:hypothetical protein
LTAAREPVVMEVGPVLAVEDVAGGKVCALASRVEPRDYADTARLLERYSPAELIGFARPPGPGPESARFRRRRPATRPHRRLGIHPIRARARRGPVMRERFASWPRTAEAARREMQASEPARQDREAAP